MSYYELSPRIAMDLKDIYIICLYVNIAPTKRRGKNAAMKGGFQNKKNIT
jgi:hypothetical protein